MASLGPFLTTHGKGFVYSHSFTFLRRPRHNLSRVMLIGFINHLDIFYFIHSFIIYIYIFYIYLLFHFHFWDFDFSYFGLSQSFVCDIFILLSSSYFLFHSFVYIFTSI